MIATTSKHRPKRLGGTARAFRFFTSLGRTDTGSCLVVRPLADIAGARADQHAGFILLDRMRDPANRSRDEKYSKRGALRQPQHRRGHAKPEIDIGLLPGEPGPR